MIFDTRDWVTTHMEVSNDRGDEIFCRCPKCLVMDGRFAVNTNTGYFNCFRGSCGNKGHVTRLVKEMQDVSWREARKITGADQGREPVHKRMQKAQAATLDFDIDLPDEFIPCWEENRDPEWRLIKYLRERQIDRETLKAWGVGFCKDGKYFNRVVVPVVSPGIRAFVARDATEEFKTNEKRPKYVNAKGKWADGALLGWPQYEQGQDLVIVEGPFDALRLASYGIPVMALLGKVISPTQRKALYKLPAKTNVILMIDPSEKLSVFNAAASQLTLKFRKSLYMAKLPLTQAADGDIISVDPGDCTEEQALCAIDSAQRWKGTML